MNVISTFYKTTQNPLTSHHHESYERFIASIPELIRKYASPIRFRKTDKETPINIEVYIGTKTADRIFLTEPEFSPSVARATSTNYELMLSADITVDTTVTVTKNGKQTKVSKSETYESIVLGHIPLMTRSKWCATSHMTRDEAVKNGEDPDDIGGYFIADGGMDKVIVSQWEDADNSLTIQRIEIPIDVSVNSWNPVLVARTRCVSSDGLDFAFLKITAYRRGISDDYYFTLSSPRLAPVEHDIWDVFVAMGIETDKDIVDMVCGSGPERPNFEYLLYPSSRRRKTTDMADAQTKIIHGIEWQSDLKKEWLYLLFAQQKIPGMTSDVKSVYSKALGLANMIRQMLNILVGGTNDSDHNDAKVKRMFTTGRILQNTFDNTVYLWTNEIRNTITKDYEYTTTKTEDSLMSIITRTNVVHTMCPNFITESMTKFMKGSGGGEHEDVIQDLSRGMSMLGTVSHLRRLNTPLDRNSKDASLREIDFQNYGRIDFTETPDGASIGLLQNLCTMAYVSPSINPGIIVPILSRPEFNVTWIHDVSVEEAHSYPKLFVNGAWWGVVRDPVDVRDRIVAMRRSTKIDKSISASIRFEDGSDVYIFTDPGRIMRPMFVIKDSKIPDVSNLKTFGDMIASGSIEYLDVYEEGNTFIATKTDEITEDHTHAEIHPIAIMSIVGANLPLLNHAQAPRAVYACGQIKQSIGRYAGNQHERFDTIAYSLFFPERPLVYTEMENLSGLSNTPFGQNIIVGIVTSSGHHIEDGIIFNKGSIDRGLFRTIAYKSVRTAEVFDKDSKIRIAPTLAGIQVREDVDRSHLDSDGIVRVGTDISREQPTSLVQMEETYKIVESERELWARRDVSLVSDKSHYGRVERIRTTIHPKRHTRVFRVRLCQVRTPTLGDKFASRSGQKGTICKIVNESDMPSCPTGLGTPDIIYNPHAFPKRETPNYQIEQLLNILGVSKRQRMRADPFDKFDVPELVEEMESYGFTDGGFMHTVDGRTGKPVTLKIFMAPMYYARLKHMVIDKMHSRAQGPKNPLTRQPADGRAKDGGFRMGEMEFNALLSHGVSNTVEYTTMGKSDGDTFYVCPRCSTYVGQGQRCEDHPMQMPVAVKHPYAWKLMCHELQASGIQVKYEFEKLELDNINTETQDTKTDSSRTVEYTSGGGDVGNWWPFEVKKKI